MDLRGARYLVEVAATGSLRKAGDRLHIAPSAISRTIALIEDEFGVPLFERAARGMVPSAAGEIYLRYARGMLRDMEHLRLALDDAKGLRKGLLRLASIEGVAGDFVVRAIAEFQVIHPGIVVELHTAGSEIVVKTVRARDVDIGIASDPEMLDGLEIAHQFRDPLLVVMAPDYALGLHAPVSFAEVMASHPVAVPDRTFAIRRQIDACCLDAHLALTPALVTNSTEALRSFARLGGGITILPWMGIREDLARGSLVSIPLSDAALAQASIDLLIPLGRQLPPITREFLDHLRAMMVGLAEQRRLDGARM